VAGGGVAGGRCGGGGARRAAAPGWAVAGAELRRTARRIVLAKRVFNIREGWRPSDDWLPQRLLAEPVTTGSGRVATLTPERLRGMISAYYPGRGLDAEGRPDEAGLAALRLRNRPAGTDTVSMALRA